MEIFTQEYKRLYHQYPAVLSKLHNSSSRILQGLPSGLFGPTILDLTQVYEASVEQLSYNYLFDPSGGIVGAFFSKILKFGLFEAVFLFTDFFYHSWMVYGEIQAPYFHLRLLDVSLFIVSQWKHALLWQCQHLSGPWLCQRIPLYSRLHR